MTKARLLFPTLVHEAPLLRRGGATFNADLRRSVAAVAAADTAGQRWSKAHGYRGYTSYASLDDLAWRDPVFAALGGHLDRHARFFARALDWRLGDRALRLDSLWINILRPGGQHGSHIHPLSVISGSYYVSVPRGAGALKLEDPRLPMMMAAPPRRPRAAGRNVTHVTIAPHPGTVVLWESWLRHEVPVNGARQDRISISFNFAWL